MHCLRLLGVAAMGLPFSSRGTSVRMPVHHELRAQDAEHLGRAGLQTGVQFKAASAGAFEGGSAQQPARALSAAAS